VKRKFRSWYLRIFLSPGYRSAQRLGVEIRRLVTFRPHVVTAFLQLDDPWSYLLSHSLRDLAAHYSVELRICLSRALEDEFMPQPDRQAAHAIRDCRLLARELGLAFLDKGSAPAVEYRQNLLELLAREQGRNDFAETFFQALDAYWRGDVQSAALLTGRLRAGQLRAEASIAVNQSLLRRLGHYGSATVFYGGEWYAGVERLMYLCARLDTLRAHRGNDGKQVSGVAALSRFAHLNLPAVVPDGARNLPPLALYYSFRSPYSYLALDRIFSLADAYGVELEVRPVLPMVMRGLPVPREKILYIVQDASREARHLGIPFGKICDPLGTGAERCIAVFFHARSQSKERAFMRSAGQAIWSEGIDVATDDGMRLVTERAGLSWPGVAAAMVDESWRETVRENRQSLTEAGLWGVPAFVIGDVALWGQDRIWLLARQLQYLCRAGG